MDVPAAGIERWYRHYRARLASMLDATRAAHGMVWHLDWHSMRSTGDALHVDAGAAQPDIVVSDRRGTSAEACRSN